MVSGQGRKWRFQPTSATDIHYYPRAASMLAITSMGVGTPLSVIPSLPFHSLKVRLLIHPFPDCRSLNPDSAPDTNGREPVRLIQELVNRASPESSDCAHFRDFQKYLIHVCTSRLEKFSGTPMVSYHLIICYTIYRMIK